MPLKERGSRSPGGPRQGALHDSLGSRRRAGAVPARSASRKSAKKSTQTCHPNLTPGRLRGSRDTHEGQGDAQPKALDLGGCRVSTGTPSGNEQKSPPNSEHGKCHSPTHTRARARIASHASAAPTLDCARHTLVAIRETIVTPHRFKRCGLSQEPKLDFFLGTSVVSPFRTRVLGPCAGRRHGAAREGPGASGHPW